MGLGLVSRSLSWMQQLDKRMLWRVATDRKEVYITFDDGPMPGLTPWVLDTLAHYGVKATFFCIGRNVAAHPDIFARLKAEGHAVGNHTWEHPNGWRTPTEDYIRSVAKCQELTRTDLFRPPYGRMTNAQTKRLRGRYQLVMWDILTGDFEQTMTGEQCAARAIKRTKPGSILVFHDNDISERNMRVALPIVLKALKEQGYAFPTLPSRTLD